jgi:hypothetical protein
MRLYDLNRLLDVLLIYLKEVGIRTIDSGEFECIIVFNDNTKLKFWNVNRWYAWMRKGEVNFSNGENLKWDDKMPSREVVFHFMRAVRKYEKQEKKQKKIDESYEKYLPIKIVRKIKLKNLKK